MKEIGLPGLVPTLDKFRSWLSYTEGQGHEVNEELRSIVKEDLGRVTKEFRRLSKKKVTNMHKKS